MTIYKRFFPNLISGFWVVVMIALWLAFAPIQAGGLASYIIVIGNSMEPGFHIGDLVIAHREADYQIGDAVVYHNLDLSSFVFHRILSSEMERFTLKGDNNPWQDTYQPTEAEIIGKLWLRVPGAGNYIQKIRNPFTMALIAGSLGGFLIFSLFQGKSRGNKYMRKKSVQEQFTTAKQKIQNWLTTTGRSAADQSSNPVQGNFIEGWFYGLGVLALASLILGIVAFSKNTSRVARDEVHFEHVGFFSYSAPAPQGVYDSNAIKSGDPIFPKLTCTIDVSFQYTFIMQELATIAGTHQLTATISEPVSGWQRSVPLQDETSFSGSAFGTSAKLDLCQMESLTQSMEAGTDFHPGSYLLTLSPNIKAIGKVSDRSLESSFNPSLTFSYDRIHFHLMQSDGQDHPLNPTQAVVLSEERQSANTILLFGVELAVPAMRWFAVLGLVGSLTCFAFLFMGLQGLSRNDRSRFIRMRYEFMLIDIQNTDAVNLPNVVNVTSIEDLAKLAERFNAMILHTVSGKSHTYFVRGEGATYRFALPVETGSLLLARKANS
jgi:signal peptidase I